MTYQVIWTAQFKKDYKNAVKRGLDISLLDDVVRLLSSDASLPSKLRDHALSGTWAGYRELHIKPDWLLIYKKENRKLALTLTRTGSHAKLFQL